MDVAPLGDGRISATVVLVSTQDRRAADRQVVVVVVGDVDLATSPALTEVLDRARRQARVLPDGAEVVVDLRPVEFLGATGMTVLVQAHRRCRDDGVSLRVVADQRVVLTPLRLTGVDKILGLTDGIGA